MIIIAVLSAAITLLLVKVMSSLSASFNDWLWSSGSRITYQQATDNDEDVEMIASPMLQVDKPHSTSNTTNTSNTLSTLNTLNTEETSFII